MHPCDTGSNGGCSQICNKKEENHECSCEDRFVSEKDGKTCIRGWIQYFFECVL